MTGLSTNELRQVKMEGLCTAYSKLPLQSNKHRSPWRRLQRLIVVLANSTFWLSASESSLCQSGLQEDRDGACLSALSRWLLEYTKGHGSGAPAWCLLNPLVIPILTSILWSSYHHLAAQEVSFLCLQYSQYRDFCQLARFK